MADPVSWDLLDWDCSSLSTPYTWADGDLGNGVSEISPPGQLRLDGNTAAVPNLARRSTDCGSTPNTFTVEIRVYHDDVGTVANLDACILFVAQADEGLYVSFGSDGFKVYDTDDGWQEAGSGLVKEGGSAEWQTWRFLVTFTGITGDGTCDVYLNDSTHNWEQVGNNITCSAEWTGEDGYVQIEQYGQTTNDMVSHADYLKIATGLYAPVSAKVLSAVVAAVGNIDRQTGKGVSADVSASASMIRKTGKQLSGTVNSVGVLARKTAKQLSGASSAIATIGRKIGRQLSGTVSATGIVGRKTGKTVSGVVAATGVVVRKTGKTLSAITTAVGTITRILTYHKTLTAAVATTAILGRKIGKSISGNVAATGVVVRHITRTIATAPVSVTGIVVRKTGRTLSTAVSAVGTMVRTTKKPVLATVSATASLGRHITKSITGNVAATGSVGRHITRTIATAIVNATGIVDRIAEKIVLGGVVATATVGRVVKKTLSTTVKATAHVTRTAYDMAYEMNKTIRQILGKVQITFTDPFFSAGVKAAASETGRMTYPAQTVDNVETEAYKWFSLHRNVLDGTFHPLPSNQEYSVGWWSATLSDAVTAEFTPDPALTITHAARSVGSLLVVGDDKLNEYPVDFWVRLYSAGDVLEYEWHETGNTDIRWTKDLSPSETGIVKQVLTIEKWSRVSAVAKISQFFTMIEQTYYSEDGDLFSIRVLEEREFSEPTIPQGNISSNVITVRLNNIDHLFTAGNFNSELYGLLLNNRAIKAWLGCDLHSGERIWFPLGTFYSRDWNAPESEPWAEVTGYDMLDRLQRTEFSTSEVYTDVTLYDLAVTVMTDAGLTAADWEIDPTLDTADYTIPYAWFDRMSHREALRRIAAAALGQVYCNRDGKVVVEIYVAAAAQPYDFHFTEGNVFEIDHPLEWSQMVNYVQARADPRVPGDEQEICADTETFTVPGSSSVTKTHYFDLSPCVDVVDPLEFVNPGGHVTLDSMTAYAWGVSATYINSDPGDETVTSVTIKGKPLEIQGGRAVVAQDADSIASNGKQTLSEPISSEFWQSEAQAQAAADVLLASYKDPRRDVIMQARGNIALLLGDRVVAPEYGTEVTSEYGLMRQDINWGEGMVVAVTAQRIIGGETKYYKTLTANVVATGEVKRNVHRVAVLATGTVGRHIKKQLSTIVTAGGDLWIRPYEKALTADVVATATVDRRKIFYKTLSGIVAATGTVGRSPDFIMGSLPLDEKYTAAGGSTRILLERPASSAGTITTVRIYASGAGNDWKVGTFYGSGTTYTPRDYVTIPTVEEGYNEFTGLSIDVEAGDYLGFYFVGGGGTIWIRFPGEAGFYNYVGDGFGGVQTYSHGSDETFSIEAGAEI